jgi:hypothetical protein
MVNIEALLDLKAVLAAGGVVTGASDPTLQELVVTE